MDLTASWDTAEASFRIRGHGNGVQIQEGNTRKSTDDVLEPIVWASQFFTLRRFDLICLGAPMPPSSIAADDEMTVTVYDVGSRRNPLSRKLSQFRSWGANDHLSGSGTAPAGVLPARPDCARPP